MNVKLPYSSEALLVRLASLASLTGDASATRLSDCEEGSSGAKWFGLGRGEEQGSMEE